MPLPAQSPEFARLATRWLDGSATLAEAAQLWESVKADPACAKEFAQQARFDLLLQDTLRARQREQGIAAGARQESKRHYRRVAQRRILAVAAIVLAAGFLLWLVLPNHSSSPEITSAPVVELSPPPKLAPPPKIQRTTVLIANKEKAGPDKNKDPLKKRLDDFFLLSVNLEKMTLREALKRLEDQLRELNFANSAELAALRVKLPPGAGDQLVTFKSSGISFLKAVRAIAGLAGYDLDVGETSVALVAKANADPSEKTHDLQRLAQSMGTTNDANRSRLAELINDARSLGLRFDISKEGYLTNLYATEGELQALTLLAQSRDQIRGLPPFQFYVRASRGGAYGQDRIISGAEADRIRAEYLRTAGANPTMISVPMMETAPGNGSNRPGELVIGAVPVGDIGKLVTIPQATPADSAPAPPPPAPRPDLPLPGRPVDPPIAKIPDTGPSSTPDARPLGRPYDPRPDQDPLAGGPTVLGDPTEMADPIHWPIIAYLGDEDVLTFSTGPVLGPIFKVTTPPPPVVGPTPSTTSRDGTGAWLTKQGTGILTVDSNSTYTGGTIANAGELRINGGTLSTSALTGYSNLTVGRVFDVGAIDANGSVRLLTPNNSNTFFNNITFDSAETTINFERFQWPTPTNNSVNISIREDANASQKAFVEAAKAHYGDRIIITIIPAPPP